MPKHHTEDYKISAVNYYLEHNTDMRQTYLILSLLSEMEGFYTVL